MGSLGANRWGKSEVRVSKIHRGDNLDGFSDVTAQVLLAGDVERAHTEERQRGRGAHRHHAQHHLRARPGAPD